MIAEHNAPLAWLITFIEKDLMLNDGNVRCKINGTMQWLCAHSQNKQENIAWLNFAFDKLRE